MRSSVRPSVRFAQLAAVAILVAASPRAVVAVRPTRRPGRVVRSIKRSRPVRGLRTGAARLGRELTPWRSPVRANRAELARVDRLVANLQADGGVEVTLKGSTLYKALGPRRRGREITDVDLVVVGARETDALAAVQRAFPEADVAHHVVRKPAFLPGVRHVQVEVPATRSHRALQIDLALYEPEQAAEAEVLRRGFPGVSFTKLKLDIPRGTRPSALLDRAWKRGGRSMPELVDPDRTGVHDVRRGLLRVNPLSTDRSRLPEGILHSMYLVGKSASYRLHRGTEKIYREMPAAELLAFLHGDGAPADRAVVRTGYLLSAFRTDPLRDPTRSLEVGRDVGLWDKVMPGMAAVTSDPPRWRRTVARVRAAYAEGSRASAPERRTREWVFGAMLAELPTEAAARRATAHLSLTAAQRGLILRSYRHHRHRA